MATNIPNYSVYFKANSILFDDSETQLIVQTIVSLYRQNENMGRDMVVPVKNNYIIKETSINRFTLQRRLKRLEDHYRLIFHTAHRKKVFRISSYLDCISQLKNLEGSSQYEEFIRLFKEEGVDSALKFAPPPKETDPRKILRNTHGTSVVLNKEEKQPTKVKNVNNNVSTEQNQTNINETQMSTKSEIQNETVDWAARVWYESLERSAQELIDKHYFDKLFIGYFHTKPKEEYDTFKNAVYNGGLADVVKIDAFWNKVLMLLSSELGEVARKEKKENVRLYKPLDQMCAHNSNRAHNYVADERAHNSDYVATNAHNPAHNYVATPAHNDTNINQLENMCAHNSDYVADERAHNLQHNAHNGNYVAANEIMLQIATSPYIYNTPYPLSPSYTSTTSTIDTQNYSDDSINLNTDVNTGEGIVTGYNEVDTEYIPYNTLNTFNNLLETVINGLKEVKEVLQEIRGTITERSEVIVPTGSKGFKWSERSERHLNPLGPPLKNEVDNEVGKGLRGCGGEGEPREATDGQTPSPLKKETAAPAPSQPLDEKEDEEEEYDDSYEAWAAFDPELAKERWKYRDIEPGEFPDLSDEPDPEDISAKPRRIPKPRKPRDILRPNTYPDSPYRKKPLFDRERLECLLNPTSTTSVTTASEFFVMIFLDNVKYLVGETEDCDEEETLKCTSYVDPEKIWGIRLYDSETRDILDNCLAEMVTFIDDKKESINLRGETIPISFEPEFDIKEFCRIVSRAIEYKWHPRGPEDPEGWEELTREFFVDFSAPDSGSVIEGFSGSEEVFERNAQLKLFKYLDEEYETGGKLTPLEEFARRFNELHINWREGYEYDIIREFLTSDKHPVQTLDKERIIRNAVSLSDELDLDMGDIWDIFFDRHVVDGKCFVLNITTSEPIFSSRRIAEKNEVLYGKRYSITHQILDEVLEERKREDAEELEWINSGEWMNDTDPLDMCPDDDELEGLGENDS